MICSFEFQEQKEQNNNEMKKLTYFIVCFSTLNKKQITTCFFNLSFNAQVKNRKYDVSICVASCLVLSLRPMLL